MQTKKPHISKKRTINTSHRLLAFVLISFGFVGIFILSGLLPFYIREILGVTGSSGRQAEVFFQSNTPGSGPQLCYHEGKTCSYSSQCCGLNCVSNGQTKVCQGEN